MRPESIIWIFGTARTGSTWLSKMMGQLPGHTVWREPLVGALFGDFYYERAAPRIGGRGKHHILGDGYRESWLPGIRRFVLDEASSRFPHLSGHLVVKEPNGSLGAPLLMEALPESRMILLMRDPRDAVASGLDAWREGGWQYNKWSHELLEGYSGSPRALERRVLLELARKDPDTFAKVYAELHLRKMSKAQQAYKAHEGRKALVRYEDLRADALGTMRRIYSTLELPIKERKLAKAVEKHSWENIPEEEKGLGKIRRKARPGSFREDLTLEQVEIVERVCAPILEEFYE
jgi:hypothetical protein